jgi:hypothetical protein
MGLVLDHLFHEAARRGAIAVSGRVIPRFLQVFADRHCVIRRRSSHTLIHARDPQLLEAFATGRAFLSLFESEGPVQLWNNPLLAVQRLQNEREAPSNSSQRDVTLEPKPMRVTEHSACLSER